MAGTDDDTSTIDWRYILNEIDFVAQHGAGTTRETAAEFLFDEIAAGRIPYHYSRYVVNGGAVPLESFWWRHSPVCHEVTVDNAVIRAGPRIVLAVNTQREPDLIFDTTKPPIRTRMTLVRLDHKAVVRCLREAASRRPPAVISIFEVPVRPIAQEAASPEPKPLLLLPPPSPAAQEAPALATQLQSTAEEVRAESVTVEPKWNPDTEWFSAAQNIGLSPRKAMQAVLDEIEKVAHQRKKRIRDILDPLKQAADVEKLLKKTASRKTYGVLLKAWRAWSARNPRATSA